jgi:predicted lipoprotein with Yx(FWY)xxD motif
LLTAFMLMIVAATTAFAQDYGTDSYGSSSSGTTSGTQAPASAQSSTGAGSGEIKMSQSSLGMIITDGDGNSLYAFTNDKGGTSTCYDECAATWPALTTEGVKATGGLTQAKLGSTKRKDGQSQVTYNNWPLYYFSPDAKPGDVKGQGVKGVWFVLDTNGKLVKSVSGKGGLPYTGPEDRLLPLAGALIAAGLAVLVFLRRQGGRHLRRQPTSTW